MSESKIKTNEGQEDRQERKGDRISRKCITFQMLNKVKHYHNVFKNVICGALLALITNCCVSFNSYWTAGIIVPSPMQPLASPIALTHAR